jgi:steroid delta-isomerase-like uncharacterized protein
MKGGIVSRNPKNVVQFVARLKTISQGGYMSVESTRQVMSKYFEAEHSDVSILAEDVVFTVTGTGQQYRGKEGVQGMLNYFYHVAFDATAKMKNTVVADQKVVGEWDFVGKHIGEFAGVPATGKSVHVPLCVAYDLENDKIKRGRVYFETPALLEQLGMT